MSCETFEVVLMSFVALYFLLRIGLWAYDRYEQG